MDYALIEDGKVINIIFLHPMNASDFANAVPINGLQVQIGDVYSDGKFYREGKEIIKEMLYSEQQIIDAIIREVRKDEL